MTQTNSKKTVMASLVLAIIACTVAPVMALAQANDQNISASLVIQVQELQDEVRTLRGRVEEQEQELDNLKQRQRDQYLDLDQRINEARGMVPAVTEAAPQASGPVSANTMNTPPAEDLPEVRKPMDTPSETIAIDQPAVANEVIAAPSEAEKEAYEKSFQALKELRYADAAEEFQSFLSSYPNSEFADNAQYWLGESYYVTRNYDIALKAFQRLLDHYPDSPKVPDAQLKIGYTYYELKQWGNARTALDQVQKRYPDTTLARLAESRLRSMKMEGHY